MTVDAISGAMQYNSFGPIPLLLRLRIAGTSPSNRDRNVFSAAVSSCRDVSIAAARPNKASASVAGDASADTPGADAEITVEPLTSLARVSQAKVQDSSRCTQSAWKRVSRWSVQVPIGHQEIEHRLGVRSATGNNTSNNKKD